MSTVDDIARRCIDDLWTNGRRYGVLIGTLRRSGRSGIETRRAVLQQIDSLARDVLEGLASGALSPYTARAAVDRAGFATALRLSETPAEMAAQLTEAFRSGDNAWTDCSPDSGPVAVLKCWPDPSHPKIT